MLVVIKLPLKIPNSIMLVLQTVKVELFSLQVTLQPLKIQHSMILKQIMVVLSILEDSCLEEMLMY